MADLTVTVKTSGGDYTSLSGAEAGEQTNLVSDGNTLTIECYPMQDTTSVLFLGWTTGASNDITITVPSAERHDGTWDTSAYRLVVSGSDVLVVREEYVTVEWLQIHLSSVSAGGYAALEVFGLGASNKINISHCILRGSGDATYYDRGILINDADAIVDIWNCIIYGISSVSGPACAAIRVDKATTVNIYSCTAIGNTYGITRNTGTVTCKNCYANGSVAAYSGTITKTTCASNDTTGSSGLQNITHSTTNFTNVTAGSEDYHLPSGSNLVDVGTDTSGDSAPLNFTTDIDEDTRSGTWDVGADEYISGGNTYNEACTFALTKGFTDTNVMELNEAAAFAITKSFVNTNIMSMEAAAVFAVSKGFSDVGNLILNEATTFAVSAGLNKGGALTLEESVAFALSQGYTSTETAELLAAITFSTLAGLATEGEVQGVINVDIAFNLSHSLTDVAEAIIAGAVDFNLEQSLLQSAALELDSSMPFGITADMTVGSVLQFIGQTAYGLNLGYVITTTAVVTLILQQLRTFRVLKEQRIFRVLKEQRTFRVLEEDRMYRARR